MFNDGQNMNPVSGVPWDGVDRRRLHSGQDHNSGPNDWYQYKFMIFEKLNGLEKKVEDIENVVEDIKVSFIKLQTKIMIVSGLSGVISAALISAVFTSLADKLIK